MLRVFFVPVDDVFQGPDGRVGEFREIGVDTVTDLGSFNTVS